MDTQISLKYAIIACIISIIIAAGLTFYLCDNHYTAKYNQLQSEYNDYKAKTVDIVNKDEAATIAKAEAEKAQNKPITETATTEATTTIEAVQKDSSNDADVQVTSNPKPIIVSYNGKQQELKTTTTESQTKTADNKVVITQQTQATLNVDDIVNREIANTVDNYKATIKANDEKAKSDIKKMNKEGNKKSAWCLVGGVLIGLAL